MTAKTNAARQREYVERQKALHRVGRKVWATEVEHILVAAYLAEIRGEKCTNT